MNIFSAFVRPCFESIELLIIQNGINERIKKFINNESKHENI